MRSDLELLLWAHWVLLNDGAKTAMPGSGKPELFAELEKRIEMEGATVVRRPSGRFVRRWEGS